MIKQINDTPLPIKVWASDLENEAEKQIRNLSTLPFIYKHVAVMADAHAGRGSTIGTVIATRGALIPSAVGVDIGCGMCALRLPFSVEELGGSKGLRQLRHSIERSIPTGRDSNKRVTDQVHGLFNSLGAPSVYSGMSHFSSGEINRTHPHIVKAALQLGTLGGGNHFIEVCADTSGTAWILLHSGSRNIGKTLAEMHISKAKSLFKESLDKLPDPDLAYLVQGTKEFQDYLTDLMWAQRYAKANRNEMLFRTLKDVSHQVYGDTRLLENDKALFRVDCHHNYCAIEEHFGQEVLVTRKGAVSAKKGEYGIIPGSMGTKSYIVKGKGNVDAFSSCSHGAGRRMSRTKARQLFTAEDLALQTEGVECRKDRQVVDEIPSSYKNIEEVMSNQMDLVEPIFELKQILCVKGA